MITNYIPNTCKYNVNNLKKVVHIFSEASNKVYIDNGEAYVDNLNGTLQAITSTSISFTETTSYNDRFQFVKEVSLTVDGYVNLSELNGKYYVVLEDEHGTYWLVNYDFPSFVTYTYTLEDGTEETVFKFSALSNFPTLKLNISVASASPCKSYSLVKVDKLKMLEKRYASISESAHTVYGYSNAVYKTVNFLKNSLVMTEEFDGSNVNTSIVFDVEFDEYKSSWHYNLLEYQNNKYVAIVNGHLACGFEMGLVPSYNAQGNHEVGLSDKVTITLNGSSQRGSIWADSWSEVSLEPQYTWRLSDEWGCVPREYRWWENPDASDYTCVDFDKHYTEYYQWRLVGGNIWYNVIPEETRASENVIEYNSTDCGYVPPLPDRKATIIYSNGDVRYVSCGESTTLTRDDVLSENYDITSITEVYIGDCVTAIGDNAFDNAISMSACTIGSGVTSIGNKAFYDCRGLYELTIPSGVTSVGGEAFSFGSGLPKMSKFTCLATTPPTVPTDIGGHYLFGYHKGYYFHAYDLQYPICVPVGSENAYRSAGGWNNYKYTIIGINNIGFYQTYNSQDYTTCPVYDKTTTAVVSAMTIGRQGGTLIDTTRVRKVYIGDSVTYIGRGAFKGFSYVEKWDISNSVYKIGEEAFDGSNIPFEVEGNVKYVGSCAYITNYYYANSITLREGTKGTGEYSFEAMQNLTTFTFPSSMLYIGPGTFYHTSPKIVIFKGTTPPNEGNNMGGMLYWSVHDGVLKKIYVPLGSEDAYKEAFGGQFNDYIEGIIM